MSIKVQEQVLEKFFPTPDDTFRVSYSLFYPNGGFTNSVEVTFSGEIDLYKNYGGDLKVLLSAFAEPYIIVKENLEKRLDKYYYIGLEASIIIDKVEKITSIWL